jgi:serine/threonine protein kinase
MELVDGHTLSELVVSSGMAIARFLEIAMPLADALAAAHQKQITHRDLKPGNVMISKDGRVKVLDFGLARVGGPDFGEDSLAATVAPITSFGVIVGTMPYMSPEQVEGRPVDARSDLFFTRRDLLRAAKRQAPVQRRLVSRPDVRDPPRYAGAGQRHSCGSARGSRAARRSPDREAARGSRADGS